jgi:hypothetical protein
VADEPFLPSTDEYLKVKTGDPERIRQQNIQQLNDELRRKDLKPSQRAVLEAELVSELNAGTAPVPTTPAASTPTSPVVAPTPTRMPVSARTVTGPTPFPTDLTPEKLLEHTLRAYPDRPTDPTLPNMGDRPSRENLYGMMGTLNATPLDYSGIEQAQRAREAQGKRNFLAGLMLAQKGGTELTPLGRTLAAEGIKLGEPLRGNAADTGYYNPETGQFVENPELARSRKEKVLQGAINALSKEEEVRARIAAQQGNATAQDILRQNKEWMDQHKLALDAYKGQTAEFLAQVKLIHEQNRNANLKPMQFGEFKELNESVTTFNNLDRLKDTWKKEFEGDITGTGGAEIRSYIANNYPDLLGKTVSEQRLQFEKDRAQWWQGQKYWDELPERHAVFGATMTANEKRAWASATIQQGMKEEQIKKNLEIRRQIVKDNIARMEEFFVKNGRIPEAVYAMTGKVTGSGSRKKASEMSEDELLNPTKK